MGESKPSPTFMAPLMGQILLLQGNITVRELDKALAVQEITGERLGEILIEMEAITEDDLELALKALEAYAG